MGGRRIRNKPCPSTGKICYRDRGAAEWAAEKILAERAATRAPIKALYPYRCPHCPWWHLTSHDPLEWSRNVARVSRGLRRGGSSGTV